MIKGRVLKYSTDDINTDVIWPGKYTYVQMPRAEMKNHAMENFDSNFQDKIIGKSILVVGKNFGCGSSREQASECLISAGIKAIIAPSFARIFYRNSINLGLPVVESPETVKLVKDDDEIEINLEDGLIRVNNHNVKITKYPSFILELIQEGGLINHIRNQKLKK